MSFSPIPQNFGKAEQQHTNNSTTTTTTKMAAVTQAFRRTAVTQQHLNLFLLKFHLKFNACLKPK